MMRIVVRTCFLFVQGTNYINLFLTLVDKTRVKLSGDGDNDYINASYVKVKCLSLKLFVLCFSLSGIQCAHLIYCFIPVLLNCLYFMNISDSSW